MRQKSAEAFAHGRGSFGPAIVLAAVGGLLIVAGFALPTASYGESAGQTPADKGSAAALFSVRPRTDQLYYFPCADCHEFMDSNTTIRELEVEEGHPEQLQHGAGQMWCFTCHDQANYGQLMTLLSKPIDFDHGYQVCSSCHSQKYLDWAHGGHGKREANWLGERILYSCVQCHNPHQPAIAPRAPQPPPPLRAGLKPMTPEAAEEPGALHRPIWEQVDGQ